MLRHHIFILVQCPFLYFFMLLLSEANVSPAISDANIAPPLVEGDCIELFSGQAPSLAM